MEETKKKLQYLDISPEMVLRVLIISDSVFLGSYLANSLLKKDIVEIYYYSNAKVSLAGLAELKKNKRFKIINKFPTINLDYIFHINILSKNFQKINPFKSLKLAFDKQAKFLLATANRYDYERNSFSSFTRNHKIDWRLVYFNYVYGPSQEDNSSLEAIFSQLDKKKIILLGKPQDRIFPVYIEDFIQGLMRCMFTSETVSEAFFLAGKEKISLMDFALKIKNLYPGDPEIQMSNKEQKNYWEIDPFTLPKVKKSWWRLVYQPKFDIDKGIQKTIGILTEQKKIKSKWIFPVPRFSFLDNFFPEINLTPRKNIMEKSFWFLNLAALLIFIFLLPFFISLFNAFLGYRKIQNFYQLIKAGNFQQLDKQSLTSERNFFLSRKIIWQYSSLIPLKPINKELQKYQDFLDFGIYMSKSLKETKEIFSSSQDLSKIIFEQQGSDPQKKN
jgi:hypothetical protein